MLKMVDKVYSLLSQNNQKMKEKQKKTLKNIHLFEFN